MPHWIGEDYRVDVGSHSVTVYQRRLDEFGNAYWARIEEEVSYVLAKCLKEMVENLEKP
jgi:hypothetical protein